VLDECIYFMMIRKLVLCSFVVILSCLLDEGDGGGGG